MREIHKRAQQAPKLPGVYIFKNNHNNIIYIGKALNLFNRVNSYFSNTNDIKTNALVKKICDIEYFITNNETEALLLENNLIKKNQPKYNIDLKDAKTYPMLKITQEPIPRIIKCREINNNKDRYFGPFVNTQTIKYLQNIFTKILKIRTCSKKLNPPFNHTPCLNYNIDKCSAPCAGHITIEEYMKSIILSSNILKGKTSTMIMSLEKKMNDYSKDLKYELASEIRDHIKFLKDFSVLQYVDTQSEKNCDYVGYYSDFNNAAISVIQERKGKIIGKKEFLMTNILDHVSILSNFLNINYLNNTNLPSQIITSENIDKSDLLKKAIKKRFGLNVKIKRASTKKEKKLVILSKGNAEIYLEEKSYNLEKINDLRTLKKILNLKKLPRIIVGFDIATLDGKYNTAAMVTFLDGKSKKSEYRQFNIEDKNHPDDYSMMEEVIGRRFQRLKNEGKSMPDLILIDGGKGQVNAAHNILSILNLNITVIGLAKKNEHVFLQNKSTPIILPQKSHGLKLLQKVRDEAHRFSNTRLKISYKNKTLKTKLLKINGLGKKRLNSIFKKYKSIKSLSKASSKNISSIEGVGPDLAKKIFDYLHS